MSNPTPERTPLVIAAERSGERFPANHRQPDAALRSVWTGVPRRRRQSKFVTGDEFDLHPGPSGK
nr:hypothetical protein [Syntrophobotulus glycolicus]